MAKLETIMVLWDVDEASNKQTATEINEAGGKAFAYKCDLTKREEIYKVAQQVSCISLSKLNKMIISKCEYLKVKSDIGNVTILVNNAGIVSGKPILELTDASIERTMQVNCMAHFWVN